jgi:hypothetical protein
MKTKLFTTVICSLMLLGLSCSSENEPNMSDNGKEQPVNLQEEEQDVPEEEEPDVPGENEPNVPGEEEPNVPGAVADCRDTSGFLDYYLKWSKTNESLLLLKGVILRRSTWSPGKGDSGTQIKVIEDIGGNFEGLVPECIFWGKHINESSTPMSKFTVNDTVFVITQKFSERKSEYYIAIACVSSLVKLSDGNVIGVLYDGYQEDTLTLEEFLLKIKE